MADAWTSDDSEGWGRRVSKGEAWRCVGFPVETRSGCERKKPNIRKKSSPESQTIAVSDPNEKVEKCVMD
jgi:hypothetical protein